MSRIIILAVLCITSTALADVDYKTCEMLNNIKNYTHWLPRDEFSSKLDSCRDAVHRNVTLTKGTIALLEVNKAIRKDQKCSFTREIEDELIECVTSITGIMKNEFTAQNAKEHFGLNTTEALVFNSKQCKTSAKVSRCVEEKFSKEKVSLELKGCKDNIIRGFDVTALICQQNVIRLDKNRGSTDLPPNMLFLGTAAMLAKLTIFSLY